MLMVNQEDVKFFYSTCFPKTSGEKSGGTLSVNEIPVVTAFNLESPQFFQLNVLHYTDIIQYRKLFISTLVEDTMFDVQVYGYNVNSNGIVTMALEIDNNQVYSKAGDEITANTSVEPRIKRKYDFVQVLSSSPISFGNVAPNESVAVWLKSEVSAVGSNNINDIFRIGIKYKQTVDATEYITKELDLYHSRISGIVDIRYCEKVLNNPSSIAIYFNMIDLSNFGADDYSGCYVVYIDNINYKETQGTDSAIVRLKDFSIPFDIKVLFVPYFGYEVEFVELDDELKNRIKLQFYGDKISHSDVVKHNLYIDKGAGLVFSGSINNLNNVGSGSAIELCNVEI